MTPAVSEAALAAHGTNPWVINDFRLLWVGRLAAVLAIQIQSTCVLWQVLDIARLRGASIEQAALYTGAVGLVQFLPLLILTLPAGEMADRRDRRLTVMASIGGELFCAVAFLGLALHGAPPLWGLLVIAAIFGVSRAFLAPASQAFLPMIVGRAALPRAIVAQSLAFQVGAIAGPAVGGLLIAVSTAFAYGVSVVLFTLALGCFVLIKTSGLPLNRLTAAGLAGRIASVKEGLAYIWKTGVVMGAISLDLVVVLLAGVALLIPIFARDILHIGPEGFGLFRASFGVGAFSMALYLARWPIVKHGGRWMFGAVAVFGVCTLIFGVSRVVWLSGAALFIAGAADMISVNIRQTLIQLATPDHMRGRVSSVSMLFIGASNELGDAFTGLVSYLLRPVGAAIFGGIGALVATGVWAKLFPDLRKADKLS
ncbi:MFS transporter [Brevundimonas sp. Leaf363]|nr:MFS transporter [Brevundimonas sp. Leaf363]